MQRGLKLGAGRRSAFQPVGPGEPARRARPVVTERNADAAANVSGQVHQTGRGIVFVARKRQIAAVLMGTNRECKSDRLVDIPAITTVWKSTARSKVVVWKSRKTTASKATSSSGNGGYSGKVKTHKRHAQHDGEATRHQRQSPGGCARCAKGPSSSTRAPFGGPERLLAYLARYTRRTAIAGSRARGRR